MLVRRTHRQLRVASIEEEGTWASVESGGNRKSFHIVQLLRGDCTYTNELDIGTVFSPLPPMLLLAPPAPRRETYYDSRLTFVRHFEAIILCSLVCCLHCVWLGFISLLNLSSWFHFARSLFPGLTKSDSRHCRLAASHLKLDERWSRLAMHFSSED